MAKIKSVLVLNEGFSDNLGDQAINESILYLLHENNIKNITSIGLTSSRTHVTDIKKKYYKTFFKDQLRKVYPKRIGWIFRNVSRVFKISKNKYDLVIIGGGQLLLSNKTFPISLFIWIYMLKLFGNKSIVMLGIGATAPSGIIDKTLISYVVKNLSDIYVRDINSQKLLKEFYNVKANIIDDVAFLYPKVYPINNNLNEGILLGVVSFEEVYKTYNKEVVSINEYYELYINLLDTNNISLDNVSLFYTTILDKKESLNFMKYVEVTYKISIPLKETDTLKNLVYQISTHKFIVSGRMHALILGLSYEKKIFIFNISQKIIEFQRQYFNENINILQLQNQIGLKFKYIVSKFI
jgi:polysaccharide pyruvyl transferase WcaK-like protein